MMSRHSSVTLTLDSYLLGGWSEDHIHAYKRGGLYLCICTNSSAVLGTIQSGRCKDHFVDDVLKLLRNIASLLIQRSERRCCRPDIWGRRYRADESTAFFYHMPETYDPEPLILSQSDRQVRALLYEEL